MDAILSIRRDDDNGWREVGTAGRRIVRNANQAKLIKAAAALQRMWHGRDVRVEEHDRSIYAPVTRTWTYHCECDSATEGDRPCTFHKGEHLEPEEENSLMREGELVLAEALERKTIRIVGDDYMGLAYDGEEVRLGNVQDYEATMEYLACHPTPDTW